MILNFLSQLSCLISQIEDEGKHGNDDTRMFVLSSLAAHKKTHVVCILCKDAMMVYDRYPLVDGTFFLSPIQHSKDCIEVSHRTHKSYGHGVFCVIKVLERKKCLNG